jgi:Glucose / Sorbosone dehydrogenase
MRSFIATVAVCSASVGSVFGADWLPTIPVGTTEVMLDLHATGLTGSVLGVDQQIPTKMVAIPDGSGRMVVTTLGGLVRGLDASGNFLSGNSGVYLDTTTAQTAIEPYAYGVTSLAFHPDFANTGQAGFGKFYTLVTEAPKSSPAGYDFIPVIGSGNNHAAVLAEYTVAPGAIGNDFLVTSGGSQNVTRRELFVAQEPDNEHNFGDLAFDSNGYLYITAGDGLFNYNGGVNPEAQNAQELGTVLGKVLRIDPLGNNSANGQYGIVASNVFAADGNPNTLGEIYSYGHRNPWRISVDDVTGQVVVGEVGHFNIEEVNIIQNGNNYGWNTMEGSFLIDQGNANLTPDVGDVYATANSITSPVFEYDHEDGKSVTGGFVYRGSNIPALQGKYIFSDFQGGDVATDQRLFAGDLATGNFEQLLISPGSSSLNQPVSFGQDQNGELYVVQANGEVLVINAPLPPSTTLVNGSFDEGGGSLSAWSTFGNTIGNVNANTEAVLDGTHSLKIYGQFNGGENTSGVSQGIAVTEGQEVTADASAFIRNQDTLFGKDNEVFMKLEFYTEFGAALDSPGFRSEIQVLIADGTTAEDMWRSHRIATTVPTGAVEARVRFVFRQLNNNNGAIHIDGVALIANLVGDLDGDGFVGIADLNIVLGAWNQSVPPGNALADPSGDGFVGIEDLNIVLGSWNNGTPPGSGAIPEPGTLAMASVGLMWLGRRRR